mmetsp:Transcript_764/g.992  ORF Transcript_764/g.992 Transcript_764/m.992 type:complete len:104 (-) Transcript_764:321-632(-)
MVVGSVVVIGIVVVVGSAVVVVACAVVACAVVVVACAVVACVVIVALSPHDAPLQFVIHFLELHLVSQEQPAGVPVVAVAAMVAGTFLSFFFISNLCLMRWAF